MLPESDRLAGKGICLEAISSYLKKGSCHLFLGEMTLDMFHSLLGELLIKEKKRKKEDGIFFFLIRR